jgi:hypothetical protein
MPEFTCVLEGCEKPSRNPKSSALCKMHYHRQYRHGSTEMQANQSGISVSLGRRYRRVSAVGHPMVDASGSGYEHRIVLYDEIGPGPHACFWCGTEVDWLPKGDPQCLQVDHLNDDGADNRPENLAPSCGRCNSTRALQARSAALRDAGWWSQHDTVARLKNQRRLPPIVA